MAAITATAIREVYGEEITPVFTRTAEEHGDFATNVAMQLAGKFGKNPREIAEGIVHTLSGQPEIKEAIVAGPGFINIRLQDSTLFTQSLSVLKAMPQPLKGKVVVAEYSDPNPFKVLHAGHLYTTLVGDAAANIIEAAGARVHRANFGGDVGLHVGKAMWGILHELGGENPEKLTQVLQEEQAKWVSDRYVAGNAAYENDEQSKQEIIAINQQVYELHEGKDKDSNFAKIYWTCRQWSIDGFKAMYQAWHVQDFDYFYESQTADEGMQLAKQALKDGVLEESDGAVVYKGEKDGLHTRVFINSAGLPTYETKDLGLIKVKNNAYGHIDTSLIITGNDIVEYMRVVLKVMSHFEPDIEAKTKHLTHGMVKLPGGKKMSSRAGSVVLANDIIEAATKASKSKDSQVVFGAVRYSFLKNRLGGDIIYDPEESVNQDGNSGPYLQYALVRARSIIRKTSNHTSSDTAENLDSAERTLARQLTMYPEVFLAALDDYSPHHIANYLYDLAVIFNRFYEQSRVMDDPRQAIRISLVRAYERVLAHGLRLLGMPTPEEM